jgi:Skp family chaperone for outer membrane proteins
MSVPAVQRQRDYALACMILSLCVALSVHLSVFGSGESLAIANARKAVANHETLLRDTTRAFQQDQDALNSARAALESIQKARRP